MSSPAERQQQFEQAISRLPAIADDARLAKNFGFSNSARIIEGGLFACTNNLESYSVKLAKREVQPLRQLVLLSVLTFPPQDEVYFAVSVRTDIARFNGGLLKLYQEGVERTHDLLAAAKPPGRISNNVKFYITSSGEIFFHNHDFIDSLPDARQSGLLDPECFAKVDSIFFAIWPPAASARRSLLAREFVGYLGSLIGRDNVHEVRVWTDAASVSPAMQRMPSTIPLNDIEKSVSALGGYYPNGEVRQYHAGLNFLPRKHFVILAGLSGTGKTQLALKYARAVHGIGSETTVDPLLFVCPVRPEWTDPTGLTGYYDVLSNRYIVPPFLEAVLVATAHGESPVFVVLDELNLARVEYYLSDVLSCVETGEPLHLHSSGVPLEGSTGTSIPAELPIPANLYVTGTINIDETTNGVSDKVLDRAIVMDMSSVDLGGFLNQLEDREPALKAGGDACRAHLLGAHRIMAEHSLGFGYRVTEEVVRYHAFSLRHLKAEPASVTDDLMVQKVLIKLRGAERQRILLTELRKVLKGLPRSEAFLARLTADLDEFGSFQASR
jgi:5-methylcytosine-specific restriction protein B